MSSPHLAAAAQQSDGGGSDSNKAKYTGQNPIYTEKKKCVVTLMARRLII